jgi:hypothetical protein
MFLQALVADHAALMTHALVCSQARVVDDFSVGAAIFDHIHRVALSPPRASRALGPATRHKPLREIRGQLFSSARQLSGHGGNFGKLYSGQGPAMQRGPKAKPPRSEYSIFQCDSHLSAMISLINGYAQSEIYDCVVRGSYHIISVSLRRHNNSRHLRSLHAFLEAPSRLTSTTSAEISFFAPCHPLLHSSSHILFSFRSPYSHL